MAWYIPLLIFGARICDVSIATVRTMLMIAGYRYISAVLGALEVTIWVLAVGGVIRYLPENPWALVGYAAGFGVGVVVGMSIENLLAIGYRIMRVVTTVSGGPSVSEALRAKGYAVTRIDGQGRDGPVEIAFLVVRRRDLAAAREIVDAVAPASFITVERAETPKGGVLAVRAAVGPLGRVM